MAAPPRSRASAAVSSRSPSPETARPAMSQWADTPGRQPAAERWPAAISALLLGTAALGLASAAARARAAAPRMDLELRDIDDEAPLPSRGRHRDCAFCKTTEDRRGATSTCLSVTLCTAVFLFGRHARSLFSSRALRVSFGSTLVVRGGMVTVTEMHLFADVSHDPIGKQV